jgi:hypothetical protein
VLLLDLNIKVAYTNLNQPATISVDNGQEKKQIMEINFCGKK